MPIVQIFDNKYQTSEKKMFLLIVIVCNQNESYFSRVIASTDVAAGTCQHPAPKCGNPCWGLICLFGALVERISLSIQWNAANKFRSLGC